MKLAPRLLAVCDFVAPNSKIADIGTDHAYIPIFLLLQNKISYAVASDIAAGPLSYATDNIKSFGLDIRTCLAPGTTGIKDNEADTLIIAGMGGDLISDILNEHIPVGINHIILQPMTHISDARRALHSHGFEIKNEKFVLESDRKKERLYTVIDAYIGEPSIWSDEDYEISPKLYGDPLFEYFVNKEKIKTEKNLSALKNSGNVEQKSYFENYLNHINKLRR